MVILPGSWAGVLEPCRPVFRRRGSFVVVTVKARIAGLDYDYAAQPREALPACNLCGSAELVTITHRDRYGFPATASA